MTTIPDFNVKYIFTLNIFQTIFLVVTICLETLIGGICACLFYVGFAVYLNSISNENNKSIYIGIGYSIFSASGLFGNMTGILNTQVNRILCLLNHRSIQLLFDINMSSFLGLIISFIYKRYQRD